MNDDYRYDIYCSISGIDFYPSKHIDMFNDFDIHNFHDKMDISPNKNSLYGEGSINISPKLQKDSDVTFSVIEEYFFNNLQALQQKIANLGLLEFHIHIDIAYKTQCNFELTRNEIQCLVNLNSTFSITCYQAE